MSDGTEQSPASAVPWWRRRSTPWIGGLLVLLLAVTPWLLFGGDDGRDDAGDDGGDRAGDVDPADPDEGSTEGRVRLRLGEGQPVAIAGDEVAVVEGEALPQARIDAVVERLEPFAGEDDDRQDFNRPAETLPPPVAGETIDTTFPPDPPGGDAPTQPDEVPAGPLEVVRVQPEGEVDIAPFLSLTFTQPMIPLATLDQLDAADVPVTVSPELPGRWRWIGTRTLRFEHSSDQIDRLPMATDYTVTVPAGTASVTGGTLAEAVSFTFATPPPTVLALAPTGESLPLEPVFVATFDQLVDPAEVLEHVTLDADGDRAVRLASDADIEADETARRIVEQALDGRWVAFRPAEPLPADTPLTVTVGEGTPSAEGPRTSTADQTFRGRTFPPLRIERTDCGFGGGCRPQQPFVITFSNPLDAAAFDPSTVTVEPELAGVSIQARGTEMIVAGATQADTTYRVTVPAALRDERGQTLGADDTREFDVGDPRPFLRPFDRDMVTVDPLAEQPSISLVSAGHEELRVVALDVDAADWRRYVEDESRYSDEVEQPDLPVLFDRQVDTGGGDGDIVETIVDLSEAFPDGAGQAVLYVEPVRTFPQYSEEYWENRPVLVWVQATHIGIDAFNDHDRLIVWTTDLRDGSPIAGARIDVGGDTATTDGDGLATIDLPRSEVAAITATVEGETALLGGYPGRWRAEPRGDLARWYVFDDRGLYRPGETVRLKGWVRRLTLSGDADLVLLGEGATLAYQVYDGQYAEIATGEATLNALGGFDLAVELPAGANLGQSFVSMQVGGVSGLEGAGFEHPFQIQEFRRPEFEVSTRAESPEPHLVTRPVTVAATASYFAGGGLPNAPVTWTVTQRDTSYRPPGWQDFSFGVFIPWWITSGGFEGGFGGGFVDDGFAGEEICCFPGGEETVERFDGVTDAGGSHYLQIDVEGDPPDQPLLVSANAAVEDVNRQAFASTTDLLVHAGERYLGLASDRAFVRGGDPLRIDAILTDIDGAAIAGDPVTITAARLVEELVDGEYVETEVDAQICELTSGDEPQRCEFTTEVGGRHRISGTVTDAEGGVNRTELEVWVSGAEAVPSRRVEQEQLTLIPAQQSYAVGDTVEILVPAPFSPATGLVTITRSGIEQTQVVAVADGSAVVEIAVTEDMVGGIGVQVDLVGAAPRLLDDGSPAPDLPDRPAYATGSVMIDVPPTSRTLTVEAVPQEAAVEPGTSTAVDVTVTDPAGAPVEGADLAVVVVDEAVLSLIGYDLADPVAAFYADPGTYLTAEYLRRTLLLSRADALTAEGLLATATSGSTDDAAAEDTADMAVTEEAEADGDGSAAGGAAAPMPAALADGDGGRSVAQADTPIEVRQDFDALAVFAPSVTTDAEGRATVDVDLPDSLTRYRVMAVAADGAERFGSGESTLTARLPLQVRPSAPRFANFGDVFELPVVLQNQTDADVDADVVLETANLTVSEAEEAGASQAGVAVTVPAGDRVEVRFPVSAEDAGTARFRVTAVSDETADSATGSLPVYTPTTTESFATYGVLDSGSVAQPLLTPEGVVPQFGGLEVTTSVTALQALTDAVIYLSEYRYDSTDAFASRLLAIAALRDVLEAFDAEGLPPAAELEQAVADDIAGLVGLQNDDGGWPVWQRNRRTEPYHTIQATHALIAARDAGYDVPADVLARAMERLRTIEVVIDQALGDPVLEYSETTRQTLRAYAVHVRALAGDPDPARAAEIHRALTDAVGDDGSLPLDALAWIWPVVDNPDIDAAIERTFRNQVTETPSAATFTTGYGEDAHLVLGSDRRTDGIVLDAFLTQQPDSDLIPKIVNGLIANQRQGRWDNVQENAFILLALKRYFDTFEAATPDLVARVWLGDLYAAEHTYEGRTIDSTLTVVPTAELLAQQDPPLVLSTEGVGRLYYRLALRTAPDDLVLEARDEGFVVQREYAAVTDPDDVVRGEDGVWRIRAGAEVEVTVTMVADSRRVNMALVDPLPAGLEIVNPALAASPALPPADEDEGEGGPSVPLIWRPTWYEHQNLRDDRAEAFSGYLPAGTYTWSYIARATTPGTFVVPPAKAEEIYTPEVFGRTATDTVVIAD